MLYINTMVSVKELKHANVWLILIAVLVGGLGFYFALVLSGTIITTINALLPNQESPVIAAWINLAIALTIIIVVGFLLIKILAATDLEPYEC